MKLKKLIIFAVVLAILGSVSVVFSCAQEAQNVRWIDIIHRSSANSGVGFILSDFVSDIPNAGEGEYEISFVVEQANPNLAVHYMIKSFEGDSSSLEHRSFTDIPSTPYSGLVTITTGKIAASYIIEAAGYGQSIRLCTHLDERGFIIKNVIVKHTVDGNEETVYDMHKDEFVQGKKDGDTFTRGSMGFAAVNSGSALLIKEGDSLIFFSPSTGAAEAHASEPAGETAVNPNSADRDETLSEKPAQTEKPAAATSKPKETSEGKTNGVVFLMIVVVAAAAVGSAGYAFILSKG